MQIDRQIAATPGLHDGSPGSDYALVRRVIAFLTASRDDPPDLDRLADHLGVSAASAQRTLERWCGLSPAAFAQALTVEHVRGLLAGSATASGGNGLPLAQAHDFAVTVGVTITDDPRRRGDGLEIVYGFHDSPFGDALVLMSEHGVCGIAFVDEDVAQTRQEALDDMIRRWPRARYREAPGETASTAAQVFEGHRSETSEPVPLVLIGTDFDVRVWQALLKIPMGWVTSYTAIARQLGHPTASRAVGTANGRNPISFAVPCHRALRSDGTLGGYYWGLTRKRAMIAWETGWLRARS